MDIGMAGGMDLRYWLTMVGMGEGWGQGGSVICAVRVNGVGVSVWGNRQKWDLQDWGRSGLLAATERCRRWWCRRGWYADRGMYFRAMLMTLISVDDSEYGLQT